MNITILHGETCALPAAEDAAVLLPQTDTDTLTLACTDPDFKGAYRVLRAIMDYGYEHDRPADVRLVCADAAVYKAYSFQWNMWFAAHKPEHDHEEEHHL